MKRRAKSSGVHDKEDKTMKSKHSLLIAAAASLFFLGSLPAYADSGSFEAYMNDGVRYFKNGNYIKAIESFTHAQEIKNIPDIPYNIARSYQMLGDCSNALKYFREYALVDAEKASKVKGYIEELNAQCGTKVGSLQMRCIPDDTVVYIDNNGAVQCNGIYELEVGEHSLRFVSNGYVEENRRIDIEENSRKSVVIDMVSNAGVSASDSLGTHESGRTNESSKSETVSNVSGESVSTVNDAPLTKLFWSGIGTSGGGLLFSIIGVSMVATSHREITYNKKTFYERSTSKLVGGGVMAGIGLAALTAGVTILVIDRIKAKNGSYSTNVVPSISVTPDSASAGVAFTF